jgi:hypothetical protein
VPKARPPGQPCVLAIVGSRDFPDIDAVRDFVLGLRPTTKVISGGARGVDLLAANAAKARGLEVEVIEAQWDELVERADHVVAFWDGSSAPTRDTIEKARAAGKLRAVYRPRAGRS